MSSVEGSGNCASMSLKHALAQMNSFDGVRCLPFKVLSNIHQNRFGVGRESLAGFVDTYFAHIGTCFVNQFQKPGTMVHQNSLSRAQEASTDFECLHLGVGCL